mmetsp:Transcript_35172/g.87974  ORF Transcript_35172/g.87974 Transcript_35172/m.87974 type:complete len:276 (+) Transcript_35172:1436-2263(+)
MLEKFPLMPRALGDGHSSPPKLGSEKSPSPSGPPFECIAPASLLPLSLRKLPLSCDCGDTNEGIPPTPESAMPPPDCISKLVSGPGDGIVPAGPGSFLTPTSSAFGPATPPASCLTPPVPPPPAPVFAFSSLSVPVFTSIALRVFSGMRMERSFFPRLTSSSQPPPPPPASSTLARAEAPPPHPPPRRLGTGALSTRLSRVSPSVPPPCKSRAPACKARATGLGKSIGPRSAGNVLGLGNPPKESPVGVMPVPAMPPKRLLGDFASELMGPMLRF